jgi:hypothetical protein
MSLIEPGTSIATGRIPPGRKCRHECRSESGELSRPRQRVEQTRMEWRDDRGTSRPGCGLCCRSAAPAPRHEAGIVARIRSRSRRRRTHGLCRRRVVRSASGARTVETSLSSAFGRSTDKRASRFVSGQRSAVGHRFSRPAEGLSSRSSSVGRQVTVTQVEFRSLTLSQHRLCCRRIDFAAAPIDS